MAVQLTCSVYMYTIHSSFCMTHKGTVLLLSIRDTYSASVTQLSTDRISRSLIEVLFAHGSPLTTLEYLNSTVGMGSQLIANKTNLSTVWLIPDPNSVCMIGGQ